MKNFFNQVIINEYLAGQGIAPHIDHPVQFGNTIATLLLGSAYVMDLQSPSQKISILLPRRSLLVLENEARYKWKHGIAKRMKDPSTNSSMTRKRGTRISITYRNDLYQQCITNQNITEPVQKKHA